MRAAALPTPAVVVTAVLCIPMAGACAGDDAGAATSTGAADTATAAVTGAGGVSTAGASVAVRLVNLWAAEGAGAAVDVYLGYRGDPSRRVLEAVPFGAASGPVSVPQDATLGVFLAGDADARLASVGPATLRAGSSLTLVLRYAPPLGSGGVAGAVDAFTDDGPSLGPGHGPARPVDGVRLVTNVSAAGAVLDGRREAFVFGTAGGGCLRPAGTAAGSGVSVGGTATASYDVTPGPLDVAAYAPDDARCAGAPRLGPASISIPAVGRSYLLAYGTGPSELRLLHVVP